RNNNWVNCAAASAYGSCGVDLCFRLVSADPACRATFRAGGLECERGASHPNGLGNNFHELLEILDRNVVGGRRRLVGDWICLVAYLAGTSFRTASSSERILLSTLTLRFDRCRS